MSGHSSVSGILPAVWRAPDLGDSSRWGNSRAARYRRPPVLPRLYDLSAVWRRTPNCRHSTARLPVRPLSALPAVGALSRGEFPPPSCTRRSTPASRAGAGDCGRQIEVVGVGGVVYLFRQEHRDCRHRPIAHRAPWGYPPWGAHLFGVPHLAGPGQARAGR